MINLTTMTGATATKAKGGKGFDTAFDDLHNEFHALSCVLRCDVRTARDAGLRPPGGRKKN